MNDARPDILLFLTDDHARWALPAYGNPALRTPNLDRLAHRGTVFEDAYTPSPVCSPARASLMTGRMPSGHGIHDFLASHPHFDGKDWLAGLPTLAERLAAEGYDCALVGKWHVGRDATPPPGFSHWFALNGEYPIHHDGDNGFSRNGQPERHVGNLTEIITDEAVKFLTERDRGRPLFLIVGYYATHSPWADQPKRLVDLYERHDFAEIGAGSPAGGLLNVELAGDDADRFQRARCEYYAAVSHIDEGLGRVVAALGNAPDTALVVYTADHGLSLGQHGIWGKGNATRPQNLLDDNIRVPLIAAGPGVLPGHRARGFVDHCDTHRWILAAAGVVPQFSLPTGRCTQFAEYGTLRMARDATHKLLVSTTGATPKLFAVGPGHDETLEVSGQPGAAEIIARLTQELDAFFAREADPARSGPDSLRPATFNFNQAWDAWVVPGPGKPAPRPDLPSQTGHSKRDSR